MQLNHWGRHTCSNPEANAGEAFTVIDLDAIHSISINFCACGHGTQSRYVQLLRAGLFPVTSEHPRAAITFRTLEVFELLSYESKVSAYEYYRTLSRLTDNTGMKTSPVRHESRTYFGICKPQSSTGSVRLIQSQHPDLAASEDVEEVRSGA